MHMSIHVILVFVVINSRVKIFPCFGVVCILPVHCVSSLAGSIELIESARARDKNENMIVKMGFDAWA